MIQLVNPNLDAVGYPDYCLAYAEAVFEAPNIKPSAWEAWQVCIQHTDPIPQDVAVPVWFSWTGTIDGETKNWGHVAINVPHVGVFSSPLSGQGHYKASSIGDLERTYGVQYVGWSEDISSIMVVGESMNADQINKLSVLASFVQADTNQNFLNNVGLPFDTAADNFLNYPTTIEYRRRALAYDEDQQTIATLKDQVATLSKVVPPATGVTNTPAPAAPYVPQVPKESLLARIRRWLKS